MSARVVLVTMPWDVLCAPSLSLGIVHQLLADAGIDVETMSLKLAWMEHILAHQPRTHDARDVIDTKDYHRIASASSMVGDWVFSLPPIGRRDPAADRTFLARLPESGLDVSYAPKLRRLRRLVPRFLAACLDEVMARAPAVVGFTSTFNQNLASLLLAYRIKRRNPRIRIVLGGANCDGPMGFALLREFSWIDAVVRGEAEPVVVDLMQELLAGRSVTPRPGLCFRRDSALCVVDQRRTPPPMDTVPLPAPAYDEYFARLRATRFHGDIRSQLFVPFQTSRGCWWGEKHHCTFCGLNGTTMAYRRHPPERAFADIVELVRRHRVLDLYAVDNILDRGYFRDLLPKLASSGLDVRLFYEVKSNLTRQEVRLLAEAGVRRIQPGIESLSTPILRLMQKGVTVLRNVRLLKWCRYYDIRVDWNLLHGFPREPPEEYDRMAGLVPQLVHLAPPRLSRLSVERFSPYQERPADYGIVLGHARWHHRHVYPKLTDAALDEIAYDFEFDYDDGRDPLAYTGAFAAAIADWQAAYAAGASLRYHHGPGFVRIEDRRRPASLADFTIESREAAIFLACDDEASLDGICARLAEVPETASLGRAAIASFLNQLVSAGLVLREEDRYLGLALPPLRQERPPGSGRMPELPDPDSSMRPASSLVEPLRPERVPPVPALSPRHPASR